MIDKLPFEEARGWVRNSAIKKTRRGWAAARKNGDIPEFIHNYPWRDYPEWAGWKNWFGTERVPFMEAREWTRDSWIRTPEDWLLAHRKGMIPVGIPRNPRLTYGEEWRGWSDWTCKWRPFEEARKWAWSVDIRSIKEWAAAKKRGEIPEDIPTAPNSVYPEWTNWPDFLGTEPLPFRKAMKWSRASGIGTAKDWRIALKLRQIPKNIPGRPGNVYKAKWEGWPHWLGKEDAVRAIWRKGVRIWEKNVWPYGTAGKEEVGEMLMTRLDNMGYYDLNLLSLPGNGREFKRFMENGFEFNYQDCLGVERERVRAIALQRLFRWLFEKGKTTNVMPIMHGDVDLLLLGELDYTLPGFNVVHLDYNGPLTRSHVLAAEAALTSNPDAIVVVTVQQVDRFGHRDIRYRFGEFPFVTMSPELLFYQPYKGIAGQRMETYCFRRRPAKLNFIFPVLAHNMKKTS